MATRKNPPCFICNSEPCTCKRLYNPAQVIKTPNPIPLNQPPYDSILLEAEGLVHGDRNADYGHPLDDFTRTAKMWSAILRVEVTPEQVGLCMMTVKISRECNHPKRDNMTDAAGYAETVEWCKNERQRRDSFLPPQAPIEDSPAPLHNPDAIIKPII